MTSTVSDESRKLIILESQIPAITQSISEVALVQKSLQKLLNDLEKVIQDVRHDVKMVASTVERIQRDQDALEKETYEFAEKTRSEVKIFGETMVASVESMTAAFKSAIDQIIQSYEKKLNTDIEPRLKKVEGFNFRIHGGLVVLGLIGGAILTTVFKAFFS